LFLLFLSHFADLLDFDLALLPYVVDQGGDSGVFNRCAWVVSFTVKIVREENIDFINQQNLWALIIIQVDLWYLSLEFLFEDVGCENATELSFSVDLKFSHFVEGSILDQILEI
jgi:hypothetical protein